MIKHNLTYTLQIKVWFKERRIYSSVIDSILVIRVLPWQQSLHGRATRTATGAIKRKTAQELLVDAFSDDEEENISAYMRGEGHKRIAWYSVQIQIEFTYIKVAKILE